MKSSLKKTTWFACVIIASTLAVIYAGLSLVAHQVVKKEVDTLILDLNQSYPTLKITYQGINASPLSLLNHRVQINGLRLTPPDFRAAVEISQFTINEYKLNSQGQISTASISIDGMKAPNVGQFLSFLSPVFPTIASVVDELTLDTDLKYDGSTKTLFVANDFKYQKASWMRDILVITQFDLGFSLDNPEQLQINIQKLLSQALVTTADSQLKIEIHQTDPELEKSFPILAQQFKTLGYTGLNLKLSGASNYKAQTQIAHSQLLLDIQHLGVLSFSSDQVGVTPTSLADLLNLISNKPPEQSLPEPKFSKLNLAYTDQGFLNKAFELYAQFTGQQPDQIKLMAIQTLESAKSEQAPLIQTAIEQLILFIHTPYKITLKIAPAQPFMFTQVLQDYHQAQSQLNKARRAALKLADEPAKAQALQDLQAQEKNLDNHLLEEIGFSVSADTTAPEET